MVKINIDFVSDVACPWCAVGLGGLLEAMRRVEGVAQVDLHFRPFELNPDMPAGGQNTIERLMAKYGYDREQVQANRKVISERAAAVGMPMRMEDDNRSFNTFDAHRLIHWAGLQGQARIGDNAQVTNMDFFNHARSSSTQVLGFTVVFRRWAQQ